MQRTFLTLRDEIRGGNIIREVGLLPEQTTTGLLARAAAMRWINERGNEQHDTLLTLVCVTVTSDERVIAAWQAVAALGRH